MFSFSLNPLRRTFLLATLTLAALTSLPASAQSVLRFNDQQNDKVLVPMSAPQGNMTLEAWVYYDRPTISGAFTTIMEFGNDDPWFGVNDNNQLDLWQSVSGGTFPRRTWSHVAYTWDGTSSRLFLNGVQVAISTQSPFHGGTSLGIGSNDTDSPWHGMIDEVMVWNVARTPAQLQSDRLGNVAPTTAGLLAYFKFNEGAGQIAHNAVPGGPNGVLGTASAVETEDPAWFITNPLATPSDLATGLALEPVTPTPASDDALVTWSLQQPAEVRVELLDALGRPVQTIAAGTFPAGPHRAALDVRALPAGIYVCRLQTPAGAVTRRTIVTH